MAERFEDLLVWQKARLLTSHIYRLTSDGVFARDFGLRDQIRKASVSVMSNIAEGFERNSDNEFRRFLMIAKGSCGEVRSQLYVAFDAGYVSNDVMRSHQTLAHEVSRMIMGLHRSMD